MKKLLFLLLLLPVIAQAQYKSPFRIITPPPPNTYAYTNLGLLVDSAVIFPKYKMIGDSVLLGVASDGKLYKLTKEQVGLWGGGSGSGADSSVFYTVYRSDTSRNNIYDSFRVHNTKIYGALALTLDRVMQNGSTLTNNRTVDLNGFNFGLSGSDGTDATSILFSETTTLLNQYKIGTSSKSLLLSDETASLINHNSDSSTYSHLHVYSDSIVLQNQEQTVLGISQGDVIMPLLPYQSAYDTVVVVENGVLGEKVIAGVDSSVYATLYNVDNAAIYPEVQPMGLIYEKRGWNAAEMGTDFLPSGGTTVALNGSDVRISSTADAWNSIVRFMPYKPTLLNNWSFTVDFKIISALASNTGFGPMIKTNNTAGAVGGYSALMFTNVGSGGTVWIYREDGVTPVATGATFAVAQNDVIRMKYSLYDSVFTVNATNLTTGLTGTVSGPLSSSASPSTPNTGTLGFLNFKGTYDVQYVKYESLMPRNGNLLVAFDSKGVVIADKFGTQFARRLNATYPTVANYSGGGDRLQDLIDKKAEVLSLNYEQIWIGLGSNDIRYGATVAEAMSRLAEIFSWYEGTSTRLYVSVIPEDSTGSGIGLTAFKNALVAAYPSNYIDLWDPLSTGNILDAIYNSGDDIHENNAAHLEIYNLAVASGLITTQSNRRTPYQTSDDNVIFKGNSIGLNFDIQKGYFNMPRWDDSLNLVQSFFKHYNDYILISPNLIYYTRKGTSLVSIDGEVSISGSTGGLVIYDRTDPTVHGIYANGGVLRLLGTGNDRIYWDQAGRMRLGTSVSTPTMTNLLEIDESTGYQGLRLMNTYTPSGSADANGVEGTVTRDASYIYVKDGTGWKRAALSAF